MPEADETDFQFLTENSVDIICRVKPDYSLKYVSPSCFRILGWTQAEMMEAPPFGLMVPEDAPAVDAAIARTAASGSPFATTTVRMRRKDGVAVWMEATSRRVLDSVTGEVKEYITVLRDISERMQFEQTLSSLALTDGLTWAGQSPFF